MFKHVRVIGVVANTTAVMLAASPSLAVLGNCSKLINTKVISIQSTFAKAFARCSDLYREDAEATVSVVPPFSKAASGCQTQLDKAFKRFTTETGKLAAKGGAGKTCTDADLMALGHLSTGTFGARWAEAQGVGALQSAYEQALQVEKDWVNMLTAMGGTGSCATCATLATAPCSETACKLAAASQMWIDFGGGAVAQWPLAGSTVLKVCDVSTLISSTAGVLYVIGGPGKVLDPVQSVLGNFCMATIASEGVIQCGGGPQKINYTACMDRDAGASNKAGDKTAGACTGDSCTASTADLNAPGVINGGTCRTLSPTAGAAGDAFINMVWRIALHQPGSDCLDDPGHTWVPQNVPLTTGTTQVTVEHAVYGSASSTLNSTPITGAVFDCATLQRGAGGPVKLVGAFPGVNTPLPCVECPATPAPIDTVIGFTLQCE